MGCELSLKIAILNNHVIISKTPFLYDEESFKRGIDVTGDADLDNMGIHIYLIYFTITPIFQFTLPAYNEAVTARLSAWDHCLADSDYWPLQCPAW